MRPHRIGTRAAILLIFLSAVAGLSLFLLGRGPSPGSPALPTPSATPERLPTATATAAPTVPPPSPTPSPLLHTVQPGETLAGIAQAYNVPLEELIAVNHIQDPNLIQVGQVLVIPGAVVTPPTPESTPPSPTGGPTPTPLRRPVLPAPTPSGPPLVEIAGVLGAGDLAREGVRIRNRGGTASLEGWTLSDVGGDRFSFPRLVLFPGGEVTLHSGPGISTPTDLYWNRAEPAWQSGGLLTLRDAEGAVVDTYVVP